jgi:hypothetical protein
MVTGIFRKTSALSTGGAFALTYNAVKPLQFFNETFFFTILFVNGKIKKKMINKPLPELYPFIAGEGRWKDACDASLGMAYY